jgi:hypothetical protein
MIVSNFDSCLEITTEEVMSQPLRIFQKLVEDSISGTSTFVTEKSSFIYPTIRLLVPQGTVVERVLLRSAFQYKLQKTSYIAEMAIYNGWNNADTKQEPLINCGVSLYHKDWDLLMTPDEGIQGPRGLDIRSLFPDELGPDDGIPSFLAHVQTLQRFVSLV